MRKTLRVLAVTALASVGVTVALPAAAASAAPVGGGFDISYPQCGSSLPSGQAWGVVGVNGGLATTANPCLPTQLAWAARSSGTVAAQPAAQLYLNTANPGQIRDQVTTWPASGATPYGTCSGGNTTACSWQYGWERAEHSVTSIFDAAATDARVNANPADYTWWLDVETANTWQTGSSAALARNRAALEGMTAYLTDRGGHVGLYSTAAQWKAIVGSVGTQSVLRPLDSWLAGASSLSGARSACSKPPLVADGIVLMTQYVSGGLDRDVSCR